VGDSAGPAGISRALRNVPVFHGIGRDVAKRCPGAWVLNLSNPMSVLTRALTMTPGVKAAGVCHGLREGAEFIRDICGIESPDRVRLDAAGINHFSWAVRLAIDGHDGWPVLHAAIRRKGARKLMPFRLDSELFLKHGAFPLFPDRHTAEFLPDEIGPGSGYGRRYGLKLTKIADRRHNLGLRKAKVRKWLQGPVPREKSDEEVTRVMAAIVAGKPFEAVLNLPNYGQFAGAPGGAVVESFGIADGLGLRPYVTPELPQVVKDLVLAHIASQELTVKAALTGSRDLALEAFALDPVTRKVRRFGEMVDRLLAANRDLLPRFFTKAGI
jgi:alpha-galactosidase